MSAVPESKASTLSYIALAPFWDFSEIDKKQIEIVAKVESLKKKVKHQSNTMATANSTKDIIDKWIQKLKSASEGLDPEPYKLLNLKVELKSRKSDLYQIQIKFLESVNNVRNAPSEYFEFGNPNNFPELKLFHEKISKLEDSKMKV
jgi:hypothetical protein